MKKSTIKKRFFIALGTMTVFGQIWSLPANAKNNFRQLYSFGDSFSDIGNFFKVTGTPTEPYFEGRLSNGPIWTDYIAEYLDLGPLPITEYENTSPQPPRLNQTDGVNFAFSGAKSGLDPDIGIETGTLKQVETFTNLVSQSKPKGNSLFTLFVGSNDYLGIGNLGMLPSSPDETEAIYTQTVDNITTVLTTLAEDKKNKAKNIVVFDMPDLNVLPLSLSFYDQPQRDFIDGVVIGHNNYLNSQLQLLSTTFPQTEFTLFSLKNLVNEIISTPENFGFTNGTEGCLFSSECSNPNDYFFWDLVHLTTSAHEIVADYVLSSFAFEHENLNLSPLTDGAEIPLLDSSYFSTFGPGPNVIVNNAVVHTPESSSTLTLITLGFLGVSFLQTRKVRQGGQGGKVDKGENATLWDKCYNCLYG